jgi:hypothetical protein
LLVSVGRKKRCGGVSLDVSYGVISDERAAVAHHLMSKFAPKASSLLDQLNSVPSIHMRCRMTASLSARVKPGKSHQIAAKVGGGGHVGSDKTNRQLAFSGDAVPFLQARERPGAGAPKARLA